MADPNEMQELHLVTFQLGAEDYAVHVETVESIIKPSAVTPVPGSPREVCGIMNLRGRVISVIDLRTCFSMPTKDTDGDTRVLVVRFEHTTVGVLVDSVSEVFTLTNEEIQPTPMHVTGIGGAAIEGIVDGEEGLIALVDLSVVLSGADLEPSDEEGSLTTAL